VAASGRREEQGRVEPWAQRLDGGERPVGERDATARGGGLGVRRQAPVRVEARSVLAFSLAIGNHFIAADHGTHTRSKAVELAVKELLR
jgi:hypothetical protein